MTAQVQRIAGTSALPFSAATKADGLVYASGTIVPDGDIRAQTKAVLDSLDATLKKAGSSLANAASVQVYIKNAADFAAMNEVYRTFWKADPPARTTIVADLVLPNGLVEMSVVAVPTGGDRTVIHPADWMKSPNPYSYGIKTGNTLFLSGPGRPQRQGQLGRRGTHGGADQGRARQRRRDPQGRRHELRQRRELARCSSPTTASSRR